LFLSPDGYGRVEDAYRNFKKAWIDRSAARAGALPRFATPYVQPMFKARWETFDDVYVGLYALNLAGVDEKADPVSEGPEIPSVLLRAVLDVEFPRIDPRSDFHETLISEYAVAEVVKFRQAIDRLIPYRTALKAAGVGCVALDFAVFALPGDNEVADGPGLPGLSKAILERDKAWTSLAEEFRCAFDLLRT
jgi:hypothetical protein